MAKMGMSDFRKDAKGKKKADIVDLKSKRKLIGFLHPDSGIEKRHVHWFPTLVEDEVEVGKGSKKKKVKKKVVKNVMVICSGFDVDPICQLRSALKDNDDIEDDAVILSLGEGNEQVMYTKGDIIGAEGFDWQKNLAYKKEYLFGFIDKDDVEAGAQVLIAPNSLGKEIVGVIDDQIEEDGEVEGDPFQNPYAFKLTYDPDESPSKMYGAKHNKTKLTEEIKSLLEGDGPDLSGLVEPTSLNEVKKMVAAALVIDPETLDLDLELDDDESKKKKDKKEDKKSSKKKVDEDDDEDDEDDEDDDDTYDNDEDDEDDEDDDDEDDDEDDDDEDDDEEDDDDEDDDEEDDDDEDDDEPVSPPKKGGKKADKKPDKKADKKPDKKAGKKGKESGKKENSSSSKGTKDELGQPERCPQCGKKLKPGKKKCSNCKAKINETVLIDCPECGKQIDGKSATCPHCGEDVIPF